MVDFDRYIQDGSYEDNARVICEVECDDCGEVWEVGGQKNYGQIDLDDDSCPNCGSNEIEILSSVSE